MERKKIIFLLIISLGLFNFSFSLETEKIMIKYDDEELYTEVVKGEVIIEIDEFKKDSILETLKKQGYDKIEKIYGRFYSAVHKEKFSFSLLSKMSFSDVKVYPNRILRLFYIPSDQYFLNQYYLRKINAPQAWDFENYKTTVTLALVDSGIDPTNPDFAGIVYSTQVVITENVSGGSTVVSVSEEYLTTLPYFSQSAFHGTAVAGIVSALRDNIGQGISGIGRIKIYSFDVFRGNVLTEKGLVEGLNRVKQKLSNEPGVVIVNMSLGTSGECDPLVASVISDLYNYNSGKKFLIVAAAGNDGQPYVSMPANCSGVVPVSATNESDKLAFFSNYGSVMKINGLSAPGTNIFTTLPGSTWSSIYDDDPIMGTSFSAPIVSAVMGAVWAKRPNYTNAQVIDIVKKTARDVDENGPDKKYGWGIVDMYKALSYLESDLSEKGVISSLIAWPNPFSISKDKYIKFSIKSDIIYPDDKLMIFDFSGSFVAWAEKDSTKGFIWDGKNSGGFFVAPGPYIAYYKSEKGTAKTKFIVLR